MAKNQVKGKQHPETEPFYPKIVGNILKMCKKQIRLFKWVCMINKKDKEAENEK